MIYNGVNFYDENNKDKSFKEFAKHCKHLGWSEEELKQVYSLITKQDKQKAASDVEPPSLN